ncbi:MAG TPA: macro domain-containing protein, partial [Leptolyngbyaceae cyanobacterium]
MVSSDDIDLSMGGGVSAALFRAGGDAVWREAQAQSPITLGNIAITTAGRLKAKRIFHAAVLDYTRRGLTTIELIRKVTKRCLVVCNELGFHSIAFPALATGVARLSPERCAVAMMLEIAAYLSNLTDRKLVVVALYSDGYLSDDVLSRFYSQVSDFLE